MAQRPGQSYGQAKNLFVSRKASGDSIVVGGMAEDSSRWTRVLSQRAAQMLWFNLTQLLYPERSDKVNALITTAPLRSADLPTITTHTTVDKSDDGNYEVTGWIGSYTWGLTLDKAEAERLWSALDGALAPQSLQNKPNPPPA
ncbi:MAG: hypothetical protein HZC41_17225 [Chloroflexi bacterium]|nr:hypothetical protein [Chloroflexota bacterium]